MPANPLESSPARDAAIDARAKELWQADGAPDGGPAAYHERAAELVAMEEAGPAGLQDVATLPDPELADLTVEEASIQDNLGDFPSHRNDQSEGRDTPRADGSRQTDK